MPGWMLSSSAGDPGTAPLYLAWHIGAALLMGVLVAALYRWARRGEEVSPTFQPTLVLLATLIAMATQIIGDNVARAFSLVGALSVVRFRTVVKDTQDTAFVILAVVVGMAAGANQLPVALVGLIIVGASSFALWPPGRARGWQGPGITLSLRVGLAESIRPAAESALAVSVAHCELLSACTARQGSLLEFTYRVRLRHGCSPTDLVAELNALEGVESVNLTRGD